MPFSTGKGVKSSYRVWAYTKGGRGSPLGNVFSTATGTDIGTKLVKRVNKTTRNIL